LEKVKSGEPVKVEREIPTAAGNSVWYEFHLTPVYSSSNDFLGVFFSAEDTTERKQTEESLRQSEERFRTIFEHSGAMMLVIDPETGDIFDANLKAESFYGYSRDQLRKMNIKNINTLPADEIQKLMNLARDKKTNHFIFQHRLASGEKKDVEVYSYPLTFGEKKYLLSIIIDITERLKMEQALKKAIDEKQAILRELQHRVKNTFVLINSIINLEINRIDQKEVRAPLESLKSRILAISKMYDLLVMNEKYQEISLDQFLRNISQSLLKGYGSAAGKIGLRLELTPVNLEVKRALPLGLIAAEIITNSLKYAFINKEKGEISIKLALIDKRLLLEIADNGQGLPESFFTGPPIGLGQEIITSLTEQIGAELEIKTEPDQGTLYRLNLVVN
ncbi:MAG: sensor histidine kinase, partial [Candidatus Saccharicenans sp.]